jgi:hypothetical protein
MSADYASGGGIAVGLSDIGFRGTSLCNKMAVSMYCGDISIKIRQSHEFREVYLSQPA